MPAKRHIKPKEHHTVEPKSKAPAESNLERNVLVVVAIVIIVAVLLFLMTGRQSGSRIAISGFNYIDVAENPKMTFTVTNKDFVNRDCHALLNLTQKGLVMKTIVKNVGILAPRESRDEELEFNWPYGETNFLLTVNCD